MSPKFGKIRTLRLSQNDLVLTKKIVDKITIKINKSPVENVHYLGVLLDDFLY